mgnify:CR=1 FL=1
MALSNWAGAAWDSRGKPTIPRLKAGSVEVELNKFWLIIYDKKAWRKDSSFLKPAVLDVYEGCLVYNRLEICASQIDEPQEGIFFYVRDRKTNRKIVGIGVYGFNKRGKWVGVTEETFQEFLKWLRYIRRVKKYRWFWVRRIKKPKQLWWCNQGSLYLAERMLQTRFTGRDLEHPEVRGLLRRCLMCEMLGIEDEDADSGSEGHTA